MTVLRELLLVDDDALVRDTLQFALRHDFSVLAAASRAEAHALIAARGQAPDVALVDLGLPPTPGLPDEGFRLIRELVAAAPATKVVVLSGQADEAHARHARTLGAVDFIAKPCEPQRLRTVLRDAVRLDDAGGAPAGGLVGTSAAIEKVRQQIGLYAHAPFPVLVQGESGSGKECVARALHERGPRAARPLYAVNCAALSATLVETTLFGHAKGAYTGAVAARRGYFEDAHDSTLLLDEIGELAPELQAKLLRVLENGQYQRVGETQTRTSGARIVAATNRDLRREVREGRFRADLYHRLSVFTIDVPPLRELAQDRLALLDHFRDRYAAQAGCAPFALDDHARELWVTYAFPGNVRELRNIVIRLTTKHGGGVVTAAMLQDEFDADGSPGNASLPGACVAGDVAALAREHLASSGGIVLDEVLGQWERGYVEAALAATAGNLTRAARLLGIQRTTLYSRMQAHGAASARRVRGQG